MQCQTRLSAGLRSVYLDDPAAGEAAYAERDVERDRPGRDDFDGSASVVTEAHDRATTELSLDLRERGLQGLLSVPGLDATRLFVRCHVNSCRVEGRQPLSACSSPRALSRQRRVSPASADRTRGHRQSADATSAGCWRCHRHLPLASVPGRRSHRPNHSNEQLFDHEAGAPTGEITSRTSGEEAESGPDLMGKFAYVDRRSCVDGDAIANAERPVAPREAVTRQVPRGLGVYRMPLTAPTHIPAHRDFHWARAMHLDRTGCQLADPAMMAFVIWPEVGIDHDRRRVGRQRPQQLDRRTT